MRIKCPLCHEKFDVGHREVLAEAERLKQRAAAGQIPADDVDGNVLPPKPRAARYKIVADYDRVPHSPRIDGNS
jgi:hypothetical protein